jgi:hypothetical protein
LVTQGLRIGEKRPFSEVAQYLDAINYLDPKFREPYRFADTLLTFQVNNTNKTESIRAARRILARGIEQFPYDGELHLNYGQFLAYLAPGHFPEGSNERTEWRRDGTLVLIRAGELSGDDYTILKALPAAAMLKRQGETDAAIRFLERLYSISDDPEVRDDIVLRLKTLYSGRRSSVDHELSVEFDTLWRKDIPFAPRSWLSILGQPRETWKCSGPTAGHNDTSCAAGTASTARDVD